MTGDAGTDPLLVGHMRALGVDLDDRQLLERSDAATKTLMERIYDKVHSRSWELAATVNEKQWVALLSNLQPDDRRYLLRTMGFPVGQGKTRIAQRMFTDFAIQVRRGLAAGYPPRSSVLTATHDLTEPVRNQIWIAARAREPWSGSVPVDVTVRAACTGLCRSAADVLPIVLTWMRRHDPESFDLLLPDPADQAHLAEFWDTLGVDPDTTQDLNGGRPDDGASTEDVVAHHFAAEHSDEHSNGPTGEHSAAPNGMRTAAPQDASSDDFGEVRAQVPTGAVARPQTGSADQTGPTVSARTTPPITASAPTATAPSAEVADPAGAAAAVRHAVEAALVSCRSTLARLEAGQAPEAGALLDLTSARSLLQDTSELLSERLRRPVDSTVAAIDDAVQELSRTGEGASALRLLLGAQVAASAQAALAHAVEQARQLLEHWPPRSTQEQATADLLAGTVLLAQAASDDNADDVDLDQRYEQVRAHAPAELLPLINAAMRGRITLTEPSDPGFEAAAANAAGAVTTTTTTPSPASSASDMASPISDDPTGGSTTAARPAVELPVEPQVAPEPAVLVAPGSAPGLVPTQSSTAPSAATSALRARTPAAPPTPAPVPVPAARSTTADEPVITPAAAPATGPAATADGTEASPATPTATDPALLAAKGARWLSSGQFALAAHLLRLSYPALATAAEFAALAAGATGPSGPHELELNARAATVPEDALVDGDAARLLSTGALLLATAVTGSATLGNLLVELSDRLDRDSQAMARHLGDAARTGLLAGRGLAALTFVDKDEADVLQAVDTINERLATPRASRLPRAAAVLQRLRSPGTDDEHDPLTLGDALAAAAADQRQHADAISTVLAKLSKPSALDRLINDDDKTNRAATSRPIDGSVRHEMLAVLRDDVAALARWVAAGQQLKPSNGDYVREQLNNLRDTLLTRHEPLLHLLNERSSDNEPLTAAAASAAHAQVQRLVKLLQDGSSRPGSEPDVSVSLTLPLLALPEASYDPVSGIAFDDALSGDPVALTQALLTLPDSGLDLRTAAERQRATDDFRSARYLLQRLPAGEREQAITEFEQAQAARIDDLGEQLRSVQQHLSRARVADHDSSTAPGTTVTVDALTEDQLSRRLGRAISLLDEADPDVRAAAATAADITGQLERLQRDNQRRLVDQLARLRLSVSGLNDDDLARVQRRIDSGQLDLAADDLTHLGAGESLFDPDEDAELAAFYPAGVNALRTGIDSSLLTAVRSGGNHPVLDGATLPESVRSEVHDGLAGWLSLRGAFEGGWKRDYVSTCILPALRLVGLDVRGGGVDALDGRPFAYARGRRFLEINNATVTGRALVPAFGSAAQGRYRLLIVWNKPTVEQLDQWRDADGSHLPLVICYLGTMSAEERVALAALWSDPTRRSTLVLDDAVLAWVAARRGTFETFMRLTLPFTATQPFIREKRPDVPPEMFYGRARERRELENPTGPSFVYGGRGLGKSALLSTIERDADTSPDDDLVVVWFEVDRVSGIANDPGLLWGELATRLESKGVTAGPRAGRANPRDRVARAVKNWTEQPGKRLLILLDEAEGFFNADAPKFADVRRLYQLSHDSAFRCKVVFSGLHSVQHYYTAGNTPFSPTGHLQIGPLSPQSAYRLLTRPLAALGYSLSTDDAQRILLECNYQPYLIQLVAEKLLSQQLDKRASTKVALLPPPWTISTADVLAALNDPATRRDVRGALGLTLDIDKRTRVIASVLALHAYDSPPGSRMADADLYTECKSAWPSGFAGTTLVAFRELLNELGGLGILADAADDSSGRAIRNETVLRALGSRDDAARHLREVERSALPVNEARGQFRPVRADNVRRSPLTTAQLGQLFRKGNTNRIIVGSTATGIDQVAATLGEVAPTMVSVVNPSTAGAYKSQLETGATDAQRLLVVSDLCDLTNLDSCVRALSLAQGEDSGAGLPRDQAASRTVALLAGERNPSWLLELAGRDDIDELVVPLERYSEYTLPLRWRGEGGLDALADGSLADKALLVTGGWPTLVEQVAVAGLRRPGKASQALTALDRMEAAHADPEWCRQLLTDSGALLIAWPDMSRLIEVLVEYDAPCSPTDVQVLAADKVLDLTRTVRLAQWFGLVTLTDSEELSLAPLISAAWRTAEATAQ